MCKVEVGPVIFWHSFMQCQDMMSSVFTSVIKFL